jgi:hypothetical protein
MKKTVMFLTIAALLSPCTVMAQRQERQRIAAQSGGLTVDQVKRLVEAGVSTELVVKFIQQNPTNFDMSIETIDSLRNARVPTEVLNAMLGSRRNVTGTQQGQLAERPQDEHGPPGPEGFGDTPRQPQAADPGRLPQARAFQMPPRWTPPARQEAVACPHANAHKVEIDLEYGFISRPYLCDSGIYCFALTRANPLYDWEVAIKVTVPTGNPLEMLKAAVQALGDLGTGKAPAAGTGTGGVAAAATKDPCPANMQAILADVEIKAATLRERLTALIPAKDSSPKPLSQTLREWEAVRTAFEAFHDAVVMLQRELQLPGAQNCPGDLLRKAEAIILDDYPKVLAGYQQLGNRLSRPTIIYREFSIDPTAIVDVVATPSFEGVPAKVQTFHFDPCYAILSASAGFLLTGLQARTYASATAPDPADPTKTQNQLRVDNAAGIRPALTALLTGSIPRLNRRNFGLGITGGLVFDVASGKADTSRFGFFGGASVRVTPWIFLTPGVHIGEFADFPQGFNRPGQVIPPNTGTPTPTKRYTGKFAFSITWKIRDLGASTASSEAKPK